MVATALYAGSFDPPTKGHAEVIEAAAHLCRTLVIAIGTHPAKTPYLPIGDRISLLTAIAEPAARKLEARVQVRSFDGLVVDLAREVGAKVLVRGVRDGTDLNYEMQMAGMNAGLAAQLRTVLVPASPATRHITATLVRQIAGMGGDISPFVPAVVAEYLDRLNRAPETR